MLNISIGNHVFHLLLVDLAVDVVDVALEDDLQEGEDEGEEHPDLHQLHVARLRQGDRYADKPVQSVHCTSVVDLN